MWPQVTKLAANGGEDRIQVAARGELQLGLLIEGMRRSGFELEISAPEVLLRQEGGKVLEPLEEAALECPLSAVGARSRAVCLSCRLRLSSRCVSHVHICWLEAAGDVLARSELARALSSCASLCTCSYTALQGNADATSS